MAHIDEEFPGRDWTGPSHMTYIDDSQHRPWDLRFRWQKSQQTWSGKITYHRKRHPFTMTDLLRIQSTVQEGDLPEAGKLHDFLWKAWTWVYRLVWRPLFVEIGIAEIVDAIEEYTFKRAWGYIMDGVIGQVSDAITEALYLIGNFNDMLPSQEKLHLIKEVEFNELNFEAEQNKQKVQALEGEVASLRDQLSEALTYA